MKTIEELADLGAAASLAELHKTQPASRSLALVPNGVFWDADQPAREAFACAIRDAVLADQPAADVPTWRPIAEWDGTTRVMFHDGFDSWCSANPVSATHFIAPPPKPDPFEGWWKEQGHGNKAVARVIWDAAVASTNERDFCVEAKKVWDASREDDLDV